MTTRNHNMTIPDYGFSKGIEYIERTFDTTGAYVDAVQHQAIEMLPTVEDDPELAARVAEQLQATHRSRAIGGRALEYATYGDGEDLQVIFFGWGGNLQSPVAVREIQGMAAAMSPNEKLLVVNNPGVGRTDVLPAAMSREVARSGSFLPYGEFVAQSLAEVMDDHASTSLRGHSYGARVAISMAAGVRGLTNTNIDSMVLTDPPGSRPLGFMGIVKGFMQLEGGHTAQYQAHTIDPTTAHLQQYNDAPARALPSMLQLAKNGGLWQQMIRDPLAMSREGLLGDLKVAAPAVTERLIINTPDLSELSDPAAVVDILGIVSQLTDAEVQQRIIREHTHSVMGAHPSILAWVYRADKA